jgi:quinol monooxygenase YgiN
LIIVRYQIRPEYTEDSPGMVAEFTAASRSEPGTISFEWSRSTDDPAVYFLVEAFRDAAAGEVHVASSHFKVAIPRIPGLLAAPPEIIHADISPEGWSRMAELQPATGVRSTEQSIAPDLRVMLRGVQPVVRRR